MKGFLYAVYFPFYFLPRLSLASKYHWGCCQLRKNSIEWPPDVTEPPSSRKSEQAIFHLSNYFNWILRCLFALFIPCLLTRKDWMSWQINKWSFFTALAFLLCKMFIPFIVVSCPGLLCFRLPLPLTCINVILQIVLLLLYNSRLLSFSNGIIFWRDTIFFFLQLFYGLRLPALAMWPAFPEKTKRQVWLLLDETPTENQSRSKAAWFFSTNSNVWLHFTTCQLNNGGLKTDNIFYPLLYNLCLSWQRYTRSRQLN